MRLFSIGVRRRARDRRSRLHMSRHERLEATVTLMPRLPIEPSRAKVSVYRAGSNVGRADRRRSVFQPKNSTPAGRARRTVSMAPMARSHERTGARVELEGDENQMLPYFLAAHVSSDSRI
jgi:hypothetical protein